MPAKSKKTSRKKSKKHEKKAVEQIIQSMNELKIAPKKKIVRMARMIRIKPKKRDPSVDQKEEIPLEVLEKIMEVAMEKGFKIEDIGVVLEEFYQKNKKDLDYSLIENFLNMKL